MGSGMQSETVDLATEIARDDVGPRPVAPVTPRLSADTFIALAALGAFALGSGTVSREAVTGSSAILDYATLAPAAPGIGA